MSIYDKQLHDQAGAPASAKNTPTMMATLASALWPKTKAPQPYVFPHFKMTHELAVRGSVAIAAELETVTKLIADCADAEFAPLRLRYDNLNMSLNALLTIAPAYRPQASFGDDPSSKTRASLIARDNQVIDMFWACLAVKHKGHGVSGSKSAVRDQLWSNESFDLRAVEEYACDPRPLHAKRNELRLPKSLGAELACLRTKAEAYRWGALLGAGNELEAFVEARGLAGDSHRPSDFKWMYVADQVTDGSYGQIRNAYGRMTAQWMPAHEFRSEMRRVRGIARMCLE